MRPDNRIVHSLWIGSYLTRLELLTLHSFVEHGHTFNLWVYTPLAQELPAGVIQRDASEIIPYEQVFRKQSDDDETGLGRGSYATFSDIFRAKLLFAHGGIWVDMDVLCLRPLDFNAPYVFRAHRVGVVMNLMKCPKGSLVMQRLIEHHVNAESDWLGFTRTLSDIVKDLELECYVRADLMPPDCWESVQPFVESDRAFDPAWYCIHWINELWTTLRRNLGSYQGRQLTDQLPDKNHPVPGSTLYGLYGRYGLLRPGLTPCSPPVIPVSGLSPRQPLQLKSRLPHINIALPSMALGGAERAIQEIVMGVSRVGGTSNVFLFQQVMPGYSLDFPGCNVFFLDEIEKGLRIPVVAAEVLASPVRSLFCHLIQVRELAELESMGIAIVPVVQNSMPSWLDSPRAFDRKSIPFVVAVSEAIKSELMDLKCPKPVIALRHELQRPMPLPEEAVAAREALRAQHGVAKNVLLIGMVGQFKAQKAYTRAVDILRAVQEQIPAQLMILGGWGQKWGAGRECYTAVCRRALETGVLADVILPGSVNPVDNYYAAFDVFLNTSFYEGLSVSLLEAIAYGCPVVCTNAGGAAEVMFGNDSLIDNAKDIGSFVKAIVRAANVRQRRLQHPAIDSALIPRLWSALGRIAAGRGSPPKDSSGRVLFLTENLNIGGPQRSLVNLLRAWPMPEKPVVGTLDSIYGESLLEEAAGTGAEILGLNSREYFAATIENVIDLVDERRVDRIVFWNVPVQVKLLLGKLFQTQSIRLVDVSPGPMLMNELETQEEFSRRITFSQNAYFERLDCFVSKYRSGIPKQVRRQGAERYRVIPNGVEAAVLADGPSVIPSDIDTRYVIGTCTRIVPTKRLEYLVDMMDCLTSKIPAVSLIVVGGVDPRYKKYARYIETKIAHAGLKNIHFVGPQRSVGPFLSAFRVFVMISDDQGCPNASLEAMAYGLPIVANPDGGVVEQVEDGVNGYLVSGENPIEMAEAVEKLLRDDRLAKTLGTASRKFARERFSIGKMVEEYLEVCT